MTTVSTVTGRGIPICSRGIAAVTTPTGIAAQVGIGNSPTFISTGAPVTRNGIPGRGVSISPVTAVTEIPGEQSAVIPHAAIAGCRIGAVGISASSPIATISGEQSPRSPIATVGSWTQELTLGRIDRIQSVAPTPTVTVQSRIPTTSPVRASAAISTPPIGVPAVAHGGAVGVDGQGIQTVVRMSHGCGQDCRGDESNERLDHFFAHLLRAILL